MDVDLDDWLPDPSVLTMHRREAAAEPGALWDAAATVRLRDAPLLGRVVRWRIPGTSAEVSFRDLFRSYPFTELAAGERWSVSGLCGRIWTRRRDYPRLAGLDEFLAWSEPGTARVLFANWIEPGDDGTATLISESRIKAVDRRAGIRVRAVWAAVGRFERLIGGEALRVAAARAEAR
jgi:hypothetical protein